MKRELSLGGEYIAGGGKEKCREGYSEEAGSGVHRGEDRSGVQ